MAVQESGAQKMNPATRHLILTRIIVELINERG